LRALHAQLADAAPVHRHSVARHLNQLVAARFDLVENLVARPHDSSAAADGVGARRSATKSAIVKSVSWPIAEITGGSDAAMARATAFLVEVHNLRATRRRARRSPLQPIRRG